MGAITYTRKRADECVTLLSSPLSYSKDFYPLDTIDLPVSKKPRILVMQHSPEKKTAAAPVAAASSSGKSGSKFFRLSRYPEVKQGFIRGVIAPCRPRFGFRWGKSSDNYREGKDKSGEFGQSNMGNALSLKCEEAKSSAFGALRSLKGGIWGENKGKEKEKEKVVSDDSSIEEVEFVGDGRDREVGELGCLFPEENGWKLGSVMVDERIIPASSSKVLDNSEDRAGVRDGSRMMSSWPTVPKNVCEPAYKELLTAAKRRDSNLRSLNFQIGLNEKRLLSPLFWRPVKKPEKDDPSRELFVQLTPEEEAEVERAFKSNGRKVLVSHERSNIQITGQVLRCLWPGAWLNDEVINLYLELLKERERREPKKFLKCHFFNTFFYSKLIGGRNGYDYRSLRRWTTQKKLGYSLMDCEKIFVPVHQQVHWCLAVINKKDEKFQYLDSLGGRDHQVLDVLAKYYVDEVKDKSGQDVDVSSWQFEYVEDLPEQENGYDCGVFMIKYIDFYSRGLTLKFGQEHMPYFRRRTAKEILRLQAD